MRRPVPTPKYPEGKSWEHAEHILENIMFRTRWTAEVRDKIAEELERIVSKAFSDGMKEYERKLAIWEKQEAEKEKEKKPAKKTKKAA